ncbi:MAG: cation-transporting P-type ATPase, partial [Myxococcaceae bacterium]
MVVLVLNSQAAPAQVVRHARAARRLRLSVPGLQWDVRAGGQVERALSAWPGVEEARADVRTGKVLVRYSPGAPLLAQLRVEPEVPRAPRRGAVRVIPRDAQPWHALPAPEVLQKLRTSSEGLSQAEQVDRLRQHGLNLQEEERSRSSLALLGRQVGSLPMALLLGSAGVSALLGDGLETAAILVVVGVNVAVGYRMEKKNQELLASWRQLEAGQATVLRDGVLRTTSAAELVPGDVLLVGPGDRIPADARVLQADRLACDEALLTGEG